MKFVIHVSGQQRGEIYPREVIVEAVRNDSHAQAVFCRETLEDRDYFGDDWLYEAQVEADLLESALSKAFYYAAGSNGQIYSAISFVGFGQHTARVESLFYAGVWG